MNLKPIACKSAANVGEVKRRVFCDHYDTCLNYAVRKNWEGFSCEKCRGYERIEMPPEHWCHDALRCTTLIYFIMFAKLKKHVGPLSTGFGRKGTRRNPGLPVPLVSESQGTENPAGRIGTTH